MIILKKKYLLVFVTVVVVVPGHAAKYEVDTRGTLVQIHVSRAGPLKLFGHNHLISTNAISGWLQYDVKDITGSNFRLSIAATALEVDNPEIRKQAGERYRSSVSQSARNGTRSNMLGPDVLNASRFPLIEVSGRWLQGKLHQPTVQASISLHGVTRSLDAPVSLEPKGDRLVASGRLSIRQSDFGIKPFSAVGGTLAIADNIDIDYRIIFDKTVK